jgi:hypothetical protein
MEEKIGKRNLNRNVLLTHFHKTHPSHTYSEALVASAQIRETPDSVSALYREYSTPR